MCGCKSHHDLSSPCTCFCDHPGDLRIIYYRKRIAVRLRYARHDLSRKLENVQISIAHKMPRWLAYHCYIRVALNASQEMPNREVPGITITEAAQVWK